MWKHPLCTLLLAISAADLWATPSLVGSPASLERQRGEAIALGMSHVANNQEYQELKDLRLLVPIVVGPNFRINPEQLSPEWRWLRPHALAVLHGITAVDFQGTRTKFVLNSAMRTLERQKEIAKTNGNATSTYYAPHAFGTSFDIAYEVPAGKGKKRRLVAAYPTAQRLAFEAELMRLEGSGCIEATKERKQRVYHVSAFSDCGFPPVPIPAFKDTPPAAQIIWASSDRPLGPYGALTVGYGSSPCLAP